MAAVSNAKAGRGTCCSWSFAGPTNPKGPSEFRGGDGSRQQREGWKGHLLQLVVRGTDQPEGSPERFPREISNRRQHRNAAVHDLGLARSLDFVEGDPALRKSEGIEVARGGDCSRQSVAGKAVVGNPPVDGGRDGGRSVDDLPFDNVRIINLDQLHLLLIFGGGTKNANGTVAVRSRRRRDEGRCRCDRRGEYDEFHSFCLFVLFGIFEF